MKKTLSSVGFEPTPTKVKQNGDERIYFLQKKYFQMQFFLILRIAIHTPPIQNERSYPNLFKKAGPKYLLVPALYEIFIWKQPFYYINFPENDFCVGTHWLQTPILSSFLGRNLQNFQVLPQGIHQTLIWRKKMATNFFMIAPYPMVPRNQYKWVLGKIINCDCMINILTRNTE